MPAALMQHDTSPKDDLIKAVGDISELKLFHNQVLCAVYIRPEKTKSGLYLPDQNRDEDRFQGKVGLIVKTGDFAFVEDGKWSWEAGIGVGDWAVFRPSDGWSITINGTLCRILDDVNIRGVIPHPDMAY